MYLTIGHNVGDTPTLSTGEICKYIYEILEVDNYTAITCNGYYKGMAEESTRIEICRIDETELNRINSLLHTLCIVLNQECIAKNVQESTFDLAS